MNTQFLNSGSAALAIQFAIAILAGVIALVVCRRYPKVAVWVMNPRNQHTVLASGLFLTGPVAPAAVGLSDISKAIVGTVFLIVLTGGIVTYLVNQRQGALGAAMGQTSMTAVFFGIAGFALLLVVIMGLYNSAVDGGSTGGSTLQGIWESVDPAKMTPVP